VEKSVNIAIPFYIINKIIEHYEVLLSLSPPPSSINVYYYSRLELTASVKIPDYQLKEYTGGYQSVLLLLLSAISLPIRSGTNCPRCSTCTFLLSSVSDTHCIHFVWWHDCTFHHMYLTVNKCLQLLNVDNTCNWRCLAQVWMFAILHIQGCMHMHLYLNLWRRRKLRHVFRYCSLCTELILTVGLPAEWTIQCGRRLQ
jgi:hypothetical protein